MKSLAAVLILATCTATLAFSAGSAPTSNDPASFGDQYTPIRRSTPKPDSSAAPKEKVPITAALSKDAAGKQGATTFNSTDPTIYCVWKAETATKGEKVRVAWFAVAGKDKKLTENTQTIPGTGSISGSGHLEKPAGGFPAGKYRVDVYDDAKLAKSLTFVITK